MIGATVLPIKNATGACMQMESTITAINNVYRTQVTTTRHRREQFTLAASDQSVIWNLKLTRQSRSVACGPNRQTERASARMQIYCILIDRVR